MKELNLHGTCPVNVPMGTIKFTQNIIKHAPLTFPIQQNFLNLVNQSHLERITEASFDTVATLLLYHWSITKVF